MLDTARIDLPPSADPGARAMRNRVARNLFGESGNRVYIGRFEVLELLGAGGMGSVYLAEDPKLGRRVALKLLHPGSIKGERERLRLMREAQALAKLSHPNVVQLYEVGDHEGSVFLAMEYVDGIALREWQRESRSPADILAVYVQAGAGLAGAHDAGLVHRDFKPANVIVGRDPRSVHSFGRVRVADFGLARGPGLAGDSATSASPDGPSMTTGSDETLTRRGAVVGTPAYMSPEQIKGAPLDARSDQFSFCVALYEALHGRRPHAEAGGVRISDEADPPAHRVLERRAHAALMRGLSADRDDRFADMRELIDRLAPARSAVRRNAFVFVGGLAMAGGVAFVASDRADPCEQAASAIDDAWNPDRAAAVRASFENASAFATIGPAVLGSIDAYAATWRDAATRACKRSATAAVPCLEREKQRLGVIASYLEAGGGDVLEIAGSTVEDLPSPDRCLSNALPDEDDRARPPADLARVRGVELALDAAALLVSAQRLAAAQDQLDAAKQQAEAVMIGSSTRARLDLLQARLDEQRGDAESARIGFLGAAASATRVDDAEILFEAWLGAVHVLAWNLERPAGARELLPLAAAALGRMGDPPRGAHRLRLAEAAVASANDDHAHARRVLSALLEEIQANPESEDNLQIDVLVELGNATARAGDRSRALGYYRDAESLALEILGDAHPRVATVRFDMGLQFLFEGDNAQARPLLESALTIKEAVYGEGSVRIASVLTALAQLDTSTGDLESARARALRAWELQRHGLVAGHVERGSALALLVNLEHMAGEPAKALEGSLLLEREYAVGEHRDELPALRNNIGWLLCDLGRCAEAEPFFASVAATSAVGTERWIIARNGMSRVLLDRGDARAAIDIVDPLLAVVDLRPDPVNPLVRGALHANAAEARRRLGDEPRACEHAAAAHDDYAEHGGPADRLRDLETQAARCSATERHGD